MKKMLLCLFGLLFFSTVFSQENPYLIDVQEEGFGYKYTQDGRRITYVDMEYLMYDIPVALKHLKAAKTANAFSSILAFSGGFLIGWPIGTLFFGNDLSLRYKAPNWNLAIIGGGCILASIPLVVLKNKNTIKAVTLHNQSRESASYNSSYELNLGVTQNGLGVTIKF